MNSIKTLLTAAILAAGAYAVYYAINHRGAETGTPSATSEAPGWPGAGSTSPTMQIPGLGGSAAGLGSGGPRATLPPDAAPASPYGPEASTGAAAGQAPPFGLSQAELPQPGTLPPAAPGTPADPGTLPFAESGLPGSGQNASSAIDSAQGMLADAGLRSASSGADGLGTAGRERRLPGATSSEPAASGGAAGASRAAGREIDPEVMNRFNALMEAVQARLDEGRLAEAHLALSTLYDKPHLPAPLARQVTELLDQLAGTVIYSRAHYLEPPYVVRPGETLEQIAQQYQVPALLLARINGISDPSQLRPGRELKVVRGPFSAVIHLDRFELTLMLNGRYAGRFAIGIGGDAPELEGAYTVQAKVPNPSYCGPDGVNIEAGDPRNPLGKLLIDLGEGVALHGTDDPSKVGRISERGVICLAPRDIDDLYGILSIGSQVVIER